MHLICANTERDSVVLCRRLHFLCGIGGIIFLKFNELGLEEDL